MEGKVVYKAVGLWLAAALALAACGAFAAVPQNAMTMPSLPVAEMADAEVSTNVVLDVDAARLEKMTVSISFDSCATNEVLVAIGNDADCDGNLADGEADIVFGCDCGLWYVADMRTGAVNAHSPGCLEIDKRDFCSSWNLLKVVRRGFGEIGECVALGEEHVSFSVRIR